MDKFFKFSSVVKRLSFSREKSQGLSKLSKKNASWDVVRRGVHSLIDTGSCVQAYKELKSSGFGIEELHFGATVRKAAIKADDNDSEYIRGLIRVDFFEAWVDHHCANIEQAMSFGYVCLLLEECELGFEALSKYKSKIADGPTQVLFDRLLFGYIRQLLDQQRFTRADALTNLAMSRPTFVAQFKKALLGRYCQNSVRNIISRLHSFGADAGANPLLEVDSFLKFAAAEVKIGDLIDVNDRSTLGNWLNGRPEWRSVKGLRRNKPLNRPIRILVASENFNFLQIPSLILKEHGFELRYLPFDRIVEALKVRRKEADNLPNMADMIFGAGPFSVSQKDAITAIENKCPWALGLIDWCDIVFVEWWKQAAVWFSRYLPGTKGLVIRLHSHEAFTSLPSFTNFEGVDSAIFIADHTREIFSRSCLNAKHLCGRQRVIQNLRLPNKRPPLKRSELEKRTLCLVGYSTRNKDPMFALEILTKLLRDDSRWRLKLIGRPWPNEVPEVDREYFYNLQKKISELGRSVELMPHTDHALSFLETNGFILSTSLREGSHESVVEGMSVGCIPILRNWPHVIPFDGANKMFQNHRTITTPKEAAGQILSFLKNYEVHSENQHYIYNNSYSLSSSAEKFTDCFDQLFFCSEHD
jgi:hypothetical protein